MSIVSHVDGKKTHVTVDTGPMVSIIKKNIVQTVSPLMEKVLLRTVNGETLPALGEAEVVVELWQLRIRYRILVANIDGFIMGVDLIGKYGFAYDPEQRILKIGNERFATVGSNLGSCVGLVEPAEDSNKHLLVARTLIKTSKTVLVRVANIAPVGIRIRKEDLLATCSPVATINICEDVEDTHKASRAPAHPNLDLKHLTKKEARKAQWFLQCKQHMFAEPDKPLGRTDIVQYRINTEYAQPNRQASRRLPLAIQEQIEKMVKEITEQGVIEESNSPWSSPVVLVKKKVGSLRFCVNYQKLNDITKRDLHGKPAWSTWRTLWLWAAILKSTRRTH